MRKPSIFGIIDYMKRILSILSFIFLLAHYSVFAQQNENQSENAESVAGADSAEAFAIIPNLEPEESSAIEPSRTGTILKTNVKNCRIYLNGTFQGLSKLTLTNLVEGFYLLRVEKEGYLFQENFIYVEHGKKKTFYIELQPNDETQKRIDSQKERAAQRAAATESTESASENTVQTADSDSLGDAK